MREKAENELFSRQTALADLGRLLAMFFRLPTLKLTEGLSGGALQEDLQAIAGELGADQSSLAPLAEYRGAGGRQLLHELRQEYTRLFTHPENPALRCHEYLFLHGDGKEAPLLHINPAALSAREAYLEAGFCPTGGHESADHISCELEFAACLLYQIAKAEKEGADPVPWQKRAGSFRKIHLARWGSAFFAACGEKSALPFYKVVGALGEVFCREYEAVTREDFHAVDISVDCGSF